MCSGIILVFFLFSGVGKGIGEEDERFYLVEIDYELWKVVVFWDLDNKLFRNVLFYDVVVWFIEMVVGFGEVVDVVVYVNCYVFVYFLFWVKE